MADTHKAGYLLLCFYGKSGDQGEIRDQRRGVRRGTEKGYQTVKSNRGKMCEVLKARQGHSQNPVLLKCIMGKQ